jgi:hypothetical protein
MRRKDDHKHPQTITTPPTQQPHAFGGKTDRNTDRMEIVKFLNPENFHPFFFMISRFRISGQANFFVREHVLNLPTAVK